MTANQLNQLQQLFAQHPDVAFAMLFGSAASGRQVAESDVDIAVYFVPAAAAESDVGIDFERPNARFASEAKLWAASEEICGREVDFVVLNRAPATVAAAALLTGHRLALNHPGLYRAYFNAVTSLAEEERAFAEDYIRVRRRSRSLAPVDRDRLLRTLDYLRTELEDASMYRDLSAARFQTDRHYRRGLERWVENLVNASIDIAKIVLASESIAVPQTYYAQITRLREIPEFAPLSEQLAANTRVRNALAHEYLDLRHAQVSSVAAAAAPELYSALADAAEAWLTRAA